MKRRLQRRMKAITARLAGEFVPRRGLDADIVWRAKLLAGVAVIAEEARAEPVDVGVRRRHEIDRISRLVHRRPIDSVARLEREHDLFRKPESTFRDHALTAQRAVT